MLKLNCLINDTRAVEDIKNAIQVLVGERAEAGKAVSFPSIYAEIRNAGLEVDAESAGSIYNEIYGKYSDSSLSTEQEIIEYSGKDVIDQQKIIVDNIIGAEPTVKENQIGKLPPEKQVANMIVKMFQQATFEGTKNVNSVMKQMETLVSKAAKALLPPTTQKATPDLFQNLNTFFNTEKAEFETLRGGVNTLETLHTAVKNEVDNYIQEVTQNLSDEDAQEFTDKWAAYTNGFIQSTYDLMLGKSDQNKLLNEALKQVQVDGVQIVDINGNIKWQTLMEDGNPDTISPKIKELFVNGIEDAQGNVQKYSREEANRIGDYFDKLYKDKLASVTQQKIGNQRSKNISAKNIISDFIKDLGFINLVKDKDGKLLLTQANWKEALETIKRQVGSENGIDAAVSKLKTFLSKQKNADGSKKFTNGQIDIIEKEFRQTVAAKLVPGTASPHAMDRLIALKNLNDGKAFQESTQAALNNVLGVGGLDQKVIDQIKELTQTAQNIIGANNVTGSASNNPTVNRGAYAFQALSQIERRIKEIIRENKISKSTTQQIVKYIGDNLGAASTSLLINPGNFGENILTGIASSIGESVTMAFTNPKLFTKLNGDFWTAFASHVSGGVANEVISEQDISPDIQAGERLRLRGFVNEFKKGWGSAAGAIVKSPAYAISIVSRTLMNSFDAGFNSSILRKKAVTGIYNALLQNGLTSKEALDAMDVALKVDAKTNSEIDIENRNIRDQLRKVGLNPTAADMEQNKRDMKLSLYEDALGAAALTNGVKTTPKQLREAAKAMIESSQLQAKVLTGKKQIPIGGRDIINRFIYGAAKGLLTPQRDWFKDQQEFERQGELGKAARSQLKAEIYKNTIGRFAGGIANFLALAVTATPYGFVTASSLQSEKKSLLRNKVDAANIFKAEPGDIRRYAEYHNLVRSMVVRASMGTLAIGAFVAKKLSDDEDDEEDKGWVSNLMQTKSGRRMLQKYLPLGINVAASLLYDVKDKKMDTKMERLLDVLSNTTGQSYDKWTNVKTAISRAKKDGDVYKAAASYFGGSLPTLNINQAEQITKFYTTLQSAIDADYVSEVKKQEEISKAIYKQQEDWVDALMTNGAIEAFQRWFFDDDGKFNRFKEKD
jgi:hypothetical protein